MKGVLAILTVLILCQSHLCASESSCVVTVGSRTYDLTSLQHTTDYYGTSKSSDIHEYKMNFCGVAVEERCAALDGSFCQYDTVTNDVVVFGSFIRTPEPTFVALPDGQEGITLNYYNGDSPCWENRTAAVDIVCGKETTVTFTVNEDNQCERTTTFTTPLVCNPDSGTVDKSWSGGSIFLLILGLSIFVYLAVGSMYKSTQNGAKGIEVIPNIDFWRMLPQYTVDGIRFFVSKIKSIQYRSSNGSDIEYETI